MIIEHQDVETKWQSLWSVCKETEI